MWMVKGALVALLAWTVSFQVVARFWPIKMGICQPGSNKYLP